MLSYPSDEVGNALLTYDQLDEAGVNPYSDVLSLEKYRELFGYGVHEFTGVDAVALAVDRYGSDEDIVYMYDENHEHYGDNQIGYYVALKSKVLQETEGGDGIILMLFVAEDGTITEI